MVKENIISYFSLRQFLKRIPFIYHPCKKVLATCHYIYHFFRLKRSAKQKPCRIVVGSGNVFDPGWIPTAIEYLNLINQKDWCRYFRPNSIDAILAEHVWEHLTKEEGITGAKICFTFLKPGGYLRIAVPDGLHPDTNYIERVRVNGTGPGAKDHKVLYTYKTLRDIFSTAGFRVDLLEWFDENGKFHYNKWDRIDGTIHRSKRFDKRNENGKLNYTSIIIDAIKDECHE